MNFLKHRFGFILSIIFFFLVPFAFLFPFPLSLFLFVLIAICFCSSLFYLLSSKNTLDTDYYLDALEEGIVIVDPSLNILKINTLASEIFGINRLEKKAKIGKRNQEAVELINKAFIQKKSTSMVLKSKPLKKIYNLKVHLNESQTFATLVIQDQTKNYQAIEMGTDFVANASHELKTPITIVRGFAETLYEHLDLTEDVRKEITKKIIANCDRMEALVKKLLALSALDEGIAYERLHKCNLLELARQAESTVKSFHSSANIVIDVPAHIFIRADKELFIQALINLLDNAVKYSLKEKKVTLTITQNDTHIFIEVKDEGIGMKKEEIPRIFERFYSIDKGASRKLGGYGLGLSIVEKIVERHGGHIKVTSEENKGSCFTLIFPKTN